MRGYKPLWKKPAKGKKAPRKTHITKMEYQKTKASAVDKSLDKFFKGMQP